MASNEVCALRKAEEALENAKNSGAPRSEIEKRQAEVDKCKAIIEKCREGQARWPFC